MDKLSALTIERAKQSIGVREEKPNWGKWVSVYLKFVNIFTPAPWCCAFVLYKVHQAAGELKTKSILPKTGYVQGLYNWAENRGYISNTPEAGKIFFVWSKELKRYAHIGFVESVKGTRFVSIEGNSNSNGSREGREVCSNTRVYVPDHHKFMRII